MSQQEGYFTLARRVQTEFTEKKSRFIGQASPAYTEEEALAFVQEIRDGAKAATHHCYAYIIGANSGLMRYQDDGEPQGTAGVPILEVLKKNKLVNAVCVVTRYYGGIQLGAGGLVRAYSKAAAMAISEAGIANARLSKRITARVQYQFWDKLSHALAQMPLMDMACEYSDVVDVSFTVRSSDEASTYQTITALSEGSAHIQAEEPFYQLWPQ